MKAKKLAKQTPNGKGACLMSHVYSYGLFTFLMLISSNLLAFNFFASCLVEGVTIIFGSDKIGFVVVFLMTFVIEMTIGWNILEKNEISVWNMKTTNLCRPATSSFFFFFFFPSFTFTGMFSSLSCSCFPGNEMREWKSVN